MIRLFTITLCFAAAIMTQAATQGIYDDYNSGEQFSSVDAIMNDVRFETNNLTKVEKRIRQLETALESFPDYPHRAITHYFLGTHHLQLNSYSDAIATLETAHNLMPELGTRTPILKYLATAQENYSKQMITRSALSALAAVIIVCILIGIKTGAGRSFPRTAYRPTVAIACVTFAALAAATFITFPADSKTLSEIFTPPVLSLSTVTTDYAQPLLMLIAYGAASIILAVLIAFSTTNVKNSLAKYITTLCATAIATSSIMVLFYMNECYDDGKMTGQGVATQFNFLGKVLIWHHEVPDKMIPLYDENLRQVINEAKKKKHE